MLEFTKRNLSVFFKDKASVFFSLLSVFIIIGLYALFLGDIMTASVDVPGARFLMDSWIMSGLLAVTSFTTTMGVFGFIVDDRAKKINKDFTVSPIKNRSIIGGYILSAMVVGVLLSVLALVFAEAYIMAYGGSMLSFIQAVKVFLLILLSTVANSSIVLFIVSFLKSNNAFATASTIIGTLIGFITGIYMPVGNFPEIVQWVIKLFPVSHAAVLFRQVMMETPISESFSGAPQAALTEFKNQLGITFEFGDTVLHPIVSIGVLVLTAVVFYLLALWSLSRKSKN